MSRAFTHSFRRIQREFRNEYYGEHFNKIMTFQPFLEIVSLADIISVNDRAFENVNEVFHK